MPRSIKLSDGKSIPAIGWGNGTGGLFGNHDPAITSGVEALKAGIYHIDTAEGYKTEQATFEAIKQAGVKREDVWITTKNISPDREVIRSNVLERIEKLGSKPDLLLIHFPTVPQQGTTGQFWTILEELVHDGTLEGVSLGVSNFRPQDLEDVFKVATIKPVVNQLEYHPYVLEHLQPVLDLGEKHGIITESYGLLTPLLRHPTGGPIKSVLEKIAKRISGETGKEIDLASVLTLWAIQKNVVVVTSSRNPVNLKKISEIDSLPELSQDEIREIEEAGRKVHFRHYKMHMTKDYPNPELPEDL
ncbi:hypothetical protein I302_104071 [Kwoniella bestiolae CBS 10118]|uniref:NADP-dependent oxidoreductase domain-containing protein n=1 Tax=Kwoniella bestiolae CBS 10118 TaxID=1296100 RepID=A0A1B9GA89_9TREE|nr:hypothetical protein I302_02776 [Kwoniella bestiolae CBS 10118]OCF27926.1 hypothetical protein I302_02776 [Kwoniella bestiolae CBS 10118]